MTGLEKATLTNTLTRERVSVQFNPEEMHASIDLLMSFKPGAVYLTHFGQVRDVVRTASDMHRLIDAYVGIAQRLKNAGTARHEKIRAGLGELMVSEIKAMGCQLATKRIHEILVHDLEINTQGLEVWLDGVSRN